ncbi:hypothetical protein Prudu_015170 [Prunus dulcis]|uniref:Uncharacterized protein n=1 Tax=Prunus dulcis TaxID=3755 RepID=A0A4Y1RJR7_PRUDU|nr:hypothetical protein Prudu_015170 [Prunus dulcis]
MWVEGIKVHADEGGVTQTRGGIYWLILPAGCVMNSLFSVYDIYDDLISRRVNSSDAERFAEECPCCTGCGWGMTYYIYNVKV